MKEWSLMSNPLTIASKETHIHLCKFKLWG